MSNFKDYFVVIETTKPIDEEGKYGLAAEVEYRQVKPLNFADLDLEPKESIVEHLKRQVRQKADIEISNIVVKEALIKAKQYDTLSNELGCPLEVVFKAIEDGIVIIGDINEYAEITLWLDTKPTTALIGEKRDFEEPRLIKYNEWCFSCNSGSYSGCVALKDYQKNWWLKGDMSNEED